MPAALWDYFLLLHTLYFKLNANIYANLHKTLQLRLIEMSEVMQVLAHKLMYWRNKNFDLMVALEESQKDQQS